MLGGVLVGDFYARVGTISMRRVKPEIQSESNCTARGSLIVTFEV
jgi:hypothetical protein